MINDWLPNIIITQDQIHIGPLKLAYVFAKEKSPDPSTQLGAVLYYANDITPISYGANRFPDGVKLKPERLSDRSEKLFFIEHAERNAIFNAVRDGCEYIRSTTLYCPWYACSDCAKAIIGCGIRTVIGHKQAFDRTPDRWKESIQKAHQMFEETGVACYVFDGNLGCDFDILFNGQLWRP